MATLETETQAAPLDTTAWEAALDAGDLPALTASLRGGSQALHVAAAHGHTAVVAWLLGHQAPVDGADASGLTPLHYAGSAAVVTLLLNAGARPAAREPRFGCTPLHTITSVKAAAALMAAGVSVELIDFRGRTPLHVAARQGNVPLVQALLDAGASPMARDDAGLTPQLHAERKKRTDVIALLRAAHTPPPAPDAPRSSCARAAMCSVSLNSKTSSKAASRSALRNCAKWASAPS